MQTVIVGIAAAVALAPIRCAVAQPAPPPPPDEKSSWVATGLALAVPATGLALAGVADAADPDAESPITLTAFALSYLLLAGGPSAGHWYAGERGHALRWSAIRLGGLGAVAGGVYLGFDAYDDDRAVVPGVLLAGIGTAVFATGLYWSLFDAHRAVARANRRGRHAPTALLTVNPIGRDGAGLSLSGAF